MNKRSTSRRPEGTANPQLIVPDDLVERLVRLADEGPQPPQGGLESVKTATRPLWRAQARAQLRRRQMVRAGVGLAAAASLLVAITLLTGRPDVAPAPRAPIAALVTMTGEVELLAPEGQAVALSTGPEAQGIEPGSWVRTGADGRAALRLSGGQSLRIDRDTRVRLASARAVELDRGAVYIDTDYLDSGHAGSARASGAVTERRARGSELRADQGLGRALEVRTSLGIARDIGTQFEVRRAGGSLTIKVREGAVSLLRELEELEIRHGAMLEIAEDGSRRTSAIPSYSSEWSWVQDVAPPFEVEGRSVVAFLDWVSRETGLWVSFANAEIERLAATTVLHGTIEGLSPAEAPGIVLAGCGLQATVRAGSLIVTSGESAEQPTSPAETAPP